MCVNAEIMIIMDIRNRFSINAAQGIPNNLVQLFRECKELDPNFQIELVAAEPLVIDPVAFEWDAAGRLWVVEMRDYPNGMDGNGKPGGVASANAARGARHGANAHRVRSADGRARRSAPLCNVAGEHAAWRRHELAALSARA